MACTKNPVIEYINYILELKNETPESSIKDLMMGDSFIEIGQTSEYCCPDCGPGSFIGPMFSFGGSAVNVTNLIKDLGEEASTGCCENYDINTIEGVNAVESEKEDRFSKNCCNDFSTCSSTFFNLMQKFLFSNPSDNFDLYSGGIHEYDTFNNQSILCLIVEIINSLSDELKTEFLVAFYELNGFTAYCNGDFVYAGTFNGFRNWW